MFKNLAATDLITARSPTSLQPRRDRSGTLLRPLRSVKIVSRGEVAERLQCMSDWGFTLPNLTFKPTPLSHL